MGIFIFEGLPGSGKTSLIRDLSKDLGCFKVGEIIDTMGKEISPKIKGLSGQSFFFDNDFRKYSLAQKMSSQGACVLMDRGYLSTIAYNLCFKDEGHRRKILILEKDLKKKYSSRDFFYIYLALGVDISLKRKKILKGNENNLWSFRENLITISNFYESRMSKLKNCLILDGSANYSDVYREVRSFILVNS